MAKKKATSESNNDKPNEVKSTSPITPLTGQLDKDSKTPKKSSAKKKRANTYETKTVVKGTFMDVINAAMKHANNNTPKPKSDN